MPLRHEEYEISQLGVAFIFERAWCVRATAVEIAHPIGSRPCASIYGRANEKKRFECYGVSPVACYMVEPLPVND